MVQSNVDRVRGFIAPRLRLGIYSRSIPRNLASNRIELLNAKDLGKNLPEIAIKPYFHPKWFLSYEQCAKNGGYKIIFGRYFWTHKSLRYFDFKNSIFGGIPSSIHNSSICLIKRVSYFPETISDNNISKYTFTVKRNKMNDFDLENGFAFNFSGANLFQHFVQDCLPILAASKKFLGQNPHIPILLPKFLGDSKIREHYIEALGIRNEVIETNFTKISIRNLFYWNFEPRPLKYILPDSFYKILQNEMSYLYKGRKSEKLVLVTRKEKFRNFANEQDVIKTCKFIAQKLKLDLVVIDSSTANFKDWKTQIPAAKIIIGMHGGALFNLIFAKPGTQLFEFVPMIGTDSTINTFAKLGVRVITVPIESSKDQLDPITIPASMFEEIYNISNIDLAFPS